MSDPIGSDTWLDARLRDVPLPAEMLARLQSIPGHAENAELATAGSESVNIVPFGTSPTDEQIDRMIAEIRIPTGMIRRLKRIAREERQRRLQHWAMAALVLIAVGLGYGWRSLILQGSQEVAADSNSSPNVRHASKTNAAAIQPTSKIANTNAEQTAPAFPTDAPSTEDIANERAAEEVRMRLVNEIDQQLATPENFPPDTSVAEDATPVRPDLSKVFAADQSHDKLPELIVVKSTQTPRGIAAPILPGYDLRFQGRYGEHPFVVPAVHKNLRSLRVPLVTSPASYAQAVKALKQGKLPAPEDIRPEEFLSAVDYGFAPAAPGTLALRSAAGPSPFAEPGMRLLQVAVQAGPSVEPVAKRNLVVAKKASLRVTFNPQAVAAYRLHGHETVTLTGSATAPKAVDLRAEDTATALFELRLQPTGGDDVATVELNWRDATSGTAQKATQRISRLQFAKTFEEAPLSLQTAALVARTAEILRGSYFAGGSKSFAPILDLSVTASPLVTDRPTMRAFLSFVEQAEKVRSHAGVPASAGKP